MSDPQDAPLVVIHMARKPLEGTVAENALKHGAGSLNIGASRVGMNPISTHAYPGYDNHSALKCKDTTVKGDPVYQEHKGRWPANVILSHLPECKQNGTRRVLVGKQGAGVLWSHLRDGTLDRAVAKVSRLGDADGLETVANWECAPGCPVADLDDQSGTSRSPVTYLRASPGWNQQVYGQGMGEDAGKLSENYGDAGGASRFFKQIQGDDMARVPQDLVTYLTNMIGAPGLPGTFCSLSGSDLDEWLVGFKDSTVPGIVLDSVPTDEQVAELLRVLLPGGHIMLIAPETQPTGHTGAIRLEDAGFEIRDAILWVRGASRLHYVAKSARREREAGCGHLTGKDSTETVGREVGSAGANNPRAGAGGRAGSSRHKCMQCGLVFDEGAETSDCSEAEDGKHRLKLLSSIPKIRNFHPCLHPDALVMTEQGYRPISEIRQSQRVYGSDGLFHPVKDVNHHPYTSEHLYEIAVQGTNYTTLASDNHPFLIWRSTRKGKCIVGGNVVWVEAQDIQKGDYTMTPLLSDTGTQGTTYRLSYVQKVSLVPYEGDVWNLTVYGCPTFQTAVGMSHNTVKPIALMQRLLADVPVEGGAVLDPFLGSGTTGVACSKTGHDFIGIEREAEYLAIADARVRHWDRAHIGWQGAEIQSDHKPPKKEEVILDLFDIFGNG